MTTADKIALFSAIGGWVSGIGTLLAVIISLYLANRRAKVRLKCDAGERIIVTQGAHPDAEHQPGVAITITNLTALPVTITSLGWECGKKNYWHQMLGDPESARLPKRLEYGEQGFFWISLTGKEETWFEDFAQQLKERGANPQKMKVTVATSSGGVFRFTPDKELLNRFKTAFAKI
ncbi:hypothetical protein [Enterobacter roggenkampii]|uniref:hypothetical protein n=1 Tax=Enterobacter roggenkampii TaxID=1812935 RepID=UPI000BA8C401|nr:hypothetical protein [Enterobacter roggenkampii]PAO24634.1 hypothetical protein CIW56_01520 [Enterobacter roggenkampii]